MAAEIVAMRKRLSDLTTPRPRLSADALYTKVQINRMVKNMAKHGVFAYGSMLKVNCWVHTDGRVT